MKKKGQIVWNKTIIALLLVLVLFVLLAFSLGLKDRLVSIVNYIPTLLRMGR